VTSDVKISWNGASEETQQAIMRKSKFSTQLANLKAFIKVRNQIAAEGGNYCSVTLQMTFMEVNLHEIADVVKLAIDNGCDRVKGHHLWAHFEEIKDENLRRNKNSIRRWNDVSDQCHRIADANLLPNGKRIRLDNFFPLPESAAADAEGGANPIDPEAVCPFLGQEAWVNNAGRFDPCCAPDEERKGLGHFGSVSEEGGLLAKWNSERYRDLVKNYASNKLCQGCNMRRPPSVG